MYVKKTNIRSLTLVVCVQGPTIWGVALKATLKNKTDDLRFYSYLIINYRSFKIL